jgi:hypothetical protein
MTDRSMTTDVSSIPRSGRSATDPILAEDGVGVGSQRIQAASRQVGEGELQLGTADEASADRRTELGDDRATARDTEGLAPLHRVHDVGTGIAKLTLAAMPFT